MLDREAAVKIPRYWTKATGHAPGERRRIALTAWGWSFTDPAEAAQRAEERLARVIERVQSGEPLPRGGYLYGDRPLREEIIREHRDDDSAPAVITRNGYGALVLNTQEAMFVDVDLPSPPRVGLLGRLFGKAPPADDSAELDKLRGALERLPGSYRVYRTAAGWRVLVTDQPHDPTSTEASAAMTQMGADPNYQHLCRVQQSFRARLTPKPWRCGQPLPPGQHPRDDDRTRGKFAHWLAGYDKACLTRATCRFVESIGSGHVHPRLAAVMALHDAQTRASEPRPLA